MYKLITVLLLLFSLTYTIRVNHEQAVPQFQAVGQWTTGSINSEIDQFIRKQFPALANAIITK